jgi:uncharacterized protein YlxW (UPF0749 family)
MEIDLEKFERLKEKIFALVGELKRIKEENRKLAEEVKFRDNEIKAVQKLRNEKEALTKKLRLIEEKIKTLIDKYDRFGI